MSCIYKYKGKDYTKDEFYSLVKNTMVQPRTVQKYEKVLFPKGDTASKIEGHTTLEEFKKQKEDRIKELEIKKQEEQNEFGLEGWRYKSDNGFYKEHNRYGRENLTKEVFEKSLKQKQEKINNEIKQLKQELERVETEGFGALKPIYKFYEETVGNILKKQYKDQVKTVTDEYGNTWYEVSINEERDLKSILFNKEQNIKNTQDANLRSKYFPESITNSLDILEKIANSNHVLNKLAKHLIKYAKENNVQIELVPVQRFTSKEDFSTETAIGYYTSLENKIYIAEFANFGGGGSEHTILHEILHSLSTNMFINSELGSDFNKLYEYAKANLEEEYPLSTISEFIVGLFTNGGFIKRLQQLKPLSTVKQYNNLFEEVLDYILSALGLTKEDTLYSQAVSIASNILETEREFNQSFNEIQPSNDLNTQDLEEPLTEDEEPYLLGNAENPDEEFSPELFRMYQELGNIEESEEVHEVTVQEDKLIDAQIVRLQNIKNELRQINENDKVAKQSLNKRASVIENSIKRLMTNRGYSTLLKVQNKILQTSIEVLDNESREDLSYIQNVIDDSQNLIALIAEVHSELTQVQKGLLSDLYVNLGKLQNKYNTVSTKLSNQAANDVGITFQDTSVPKRDIGTLGKYFLSAAEAKDIPELQGISKWIQYSKNKITEQVSNLKEKIFNIKLNNPDWKNLLKSFFDSDGKFITQFSSEFYNEEKKVNQEKDAVLRNPESTNLEKALAFTKVRDWYIENATYQRSEVGDAIWEQELENWLKVNEDLKEENPAWYEQELYQFIQENSPQAYLDYIAAVKINPEYYQPGIKKRIGYRKLLVLPNSKYINPRYDDIKDNPVYNLIRDTIIEAQKLIPRKMTFDTGNFDKVLNDFTLDLSTQDPFTIKGLIGGLGKVFTEWYTPAKEGSNLSFNAVDSKGNDISFILAPKIKEFQESSPEDLFDVLTKFYEMAVTYDNNSKILPTLQLMSSKLSERSKIKTNSFGTPIYSPKIDTRQFITDEYGNSVVNPKLGKVMRDSEGKIIKNDTPDEIKQGLNNARDLALFTIQSQIFGKTKADEDTQFSFWADKLINYTRLLGIGGKIFSALNNYIVGKANNFAWAAKGGDFDDKALTQAQSVIYSNIMRAFNINKSITKEGKKLALLLDKYNIMSTGLNKFEGDIQTKFTDVMYFLMTSGEYMIHSEGFLAKMLFTKLTKLDGTEGNLWDYIQVGENNEIKYNTEEYGEQNYSEISPNSKLNNWLYQYNEYRKATQGDYSNPLYINQWWWGRALMIFRRWLPQAAYQRFGRESEDKTFKGRFLSVGDIYDFFKGNNPDIPYIGKTIPIIRVIGRLIGESTYYSAIRRKVQGKNFVDDFKELGLENIDIQNMLINVRELRMAAMMFGIVLALGFAGGDDDPELVPVINTANRVFQDLTFFMNPNSAAAIIRNPLPMITTLSKLNDVKKYTLNYIGGGEDTYQRGIYEGKSKLGMSIIKVIPGAASIPSTVSTISTEFSPESYRFGN